MMLFPAQKSLPAPQLLNKVQTSQPYGQAIPNWSQFQCPPSSLVILLRAVLCVNQQNFQMSMDTFLYVCIHLCQLLFPCNMSAFFQAGHAYFQAHRKCSHLISASFSYPSSCMSLLSLLTSYDILFLLILRHFSLLTLF